MSVPKLNRQPKHEAAWSQASLAIACANLAAAECDLDLKKRGVLQAARDGKSGNGASLASAKASDARDAAIVAVAAAAMSWWRGHHTD